MSEHLDYNSGHRLRNEYTGRQLDKSALVEGTIFILTIPSSHIEINCSLMSLDSLLITRVHAVIHHCLFPTLACSMHVHQIIQTAEEESNALPRNHDNHQPILQFLKTYRKYRKSLPKSIPGHQMVIPKAFSSVPNPVIHPPQSLLLLRPLPLLPLHLPLLLFAHPLLAPA